MVESTHFTFPAIDEAAYTREIDALYQRLFPLCRSLTGDGVRGTLAALREVCDFNILEIKSGTQCYDWIVPDEWNIRAAYIRDAQGRDVVNFRDNTLHVVSYSTPVRATMTFDELRPHLHTLPAEPAAIPYRTSYYKRDWGFCLSHETLERMDPAGRYEVCIDATLAPGHMTWGEKVLPGRSGREYLVAAYCCHPSMANDSLSGQIAWALLLRELQKQPTRHGWRFILVPETVGAIAYLALHELAMRNLAGGFVLTTMAGKGRFGYKQTFLGDHEIDRVARSVFREQGLEPAFYPFDINGSDEKQYSSPHFRIPVGTITKDKYYEYKEYHTSLDNLDFVSPQALLESVKLYWFALEQLELNLTCRSLCPQGEPMLGRRGLYPQLGGSIRQQAAARQDHAQRAYRVGEDQLLYGSELDALRWVLFYADGRTSLLDAAERTKLPLRQLHAAALQLRRHGLLEFVEH